MNDAEAETLLRQLSEHFNQPVMPASRYCDALETWTNALRNGHEDRTSPRPPEERHGHRYLDPDLLTLILIDIRKSGLLDRLIYGGQTLRSRKCMYHKGHMDTSAYCFGTSCLCRGSGWLPEGAIPKCQEPGCQNDAVAGGQCFSPEGATWNCVDSFYVCHDHGGPKQAGHLRHLHFLNEHPEHHKHSPAADYDAYMDWAMLLNRKPWETK